MLSRVARPITQHQPRRVGPRCFTTVTQLPNGVRVATQKTHDKHVSVGVWGEAGARFENAGGEAHLLSKCMWKGTPKRSGDTLIKEVENMGGFLSVDCGREHSHVSVTCDGSALKQGLDIVHDVTYNSASDAKVFGDVKNEAEANVDAGMFSTQDLMMDRTYMSVYRDGGLGHSLYPNDFSDATQQGVVNFRDTNFAANRVVVTAAGNVNHEEFVNEVGAKFGSVKELPPLRVEEKPYFVGAKMDFRNDEMGSLIYFTLSWRGCSWRSPDAIVYMLIAELLGSHDMHNPRRILPGSLSGNRLTNHMCNKHGDTHGSKIACFEYYEARHDFYRDTGLLSVFAVCDEVAIDHCRSEIQFAVNMLPGGTTEEEVTRAKRRLKMKLFQGGENTYERAKGLGSQILGLGRYVSPEELCLRIDCLDKEDLHRVAYKDLHDNEISVTALGPTHGLLSITTLRRDNMMWRA